MSVRPHQIFWVLLLGFLWGINWPAVKYMLTEMSPLTIRAIAFPAAAVLLALWVCVTGQRLMPARRDWPAIVVTAFFLIFSFNILSSFGQVFTQASKAAIIAYTMPAMTGVLAAIFLREKLTRWSVLALLVGMAGLAVLASEDFQAIAADHRGTLVMLTAALCWAIGNVCLKARRWSIPPLALTAWFFAIASVMCWPLALYFEPPSTQTVPSPGVLMALGYLILGPMVICYAIWTTLVDRLPTTVAALSALTAPVVGVISAMVLIGEPLTWQKTISLAMIVLSVMLTLKSASAAAKT